MKLTKYEIYVLQKSYQLKILPNKEMLNFKHICEDIKVTYTEYRWFNSLRILWHHEFYKKL